MRASAITHRRGINVQRQIGTIVITRHETMQPLVYQGLTCILSIACELLDYKSEVVGVCVHDNWWADMHDLDAWNYTNGWHT